MAVDARDYFAFAKDRANTNKWWQKGSEFEPDWETMIDRVKSETKWLNWDKTNTSVKTVDGVLITNYWTVTEFKKWGSIWLDIITFEQNDQFNNVRISLRRKEETAIVPSDISTKIADDFAGAYEMFEALVEAVKNLDCSKGYIMHKPLADGTLKNMNKEELIRYIRTLENNLQAANERCENQFEYIKTLKNETVNAIVAELKKYGIKMSTARTPHQYFKAISLKSAIAIVKSHGHFE